eukprot:TRINITY_DN23165_c0_g1_i1.p1 TRINITY_DN23165_c0_g1~~TRINITY_DN23165_c0_g1_i1.p1  ORF type:complete len:419 (+),score=76.69 TRINITY_DN23165_c0_g1_i1:522-1778(+)
MLKWFSLSRPHDSLTELTAVCTRIDGLELVLNELKAVVGELRQRCTDREDVLKEKLEVIYRWEEIEEPLMRCVRDLQCIVSGDKTVVDLAKIQTRRVETLLEEGSNLTAMLSAARWAVQESSETTPGYLKTHDWLEKTSALEQEETKCRFEYERGEQLLYSDLMKNVDAQRRKRKKPRTGDPSDGIPAHWVSSSQLSTRIIDCTDEMSRLLFPIFEGSGVIKQIERIESYGMWAGYVSGLAKVRQRGRSREGYVQVVTETDLMMEGVEMPEGDLACDVNEKWLLLPCKGDHDVAGIIESGVHTMRRTHGLYGPGIYLAETPARVNKVTGGLSPTVILARVVLTPSPHVTSAPHPPSATPQPATIALSKTSHPRLLPPPNSSSWLDEHREFIVTDSSLVYPAYVIRYTKASDSLAFRTY